MNIKMFQLKLKAADFNFNKNAILNNLDFDGLSVFPSISFIPNFYDLLEEIALNNKDKVFVFGTYLVKDGKIIDVCDDYFDFQSKKIYVSEDLKQDVECDLYILGKNRYFTMNGLDKLVASIDVKNLISVNPVMLDDENVYAGQSFAINNYSEYLYQLPICKEEVQEIDYDYFSTPLNADLKDLADEFNYDIYTTEEAVLEVLKFALKEYMENCGFKKVILGLSGGIDSALTAAIAYQAIGAENVHTVMLPSMYSSKGSIDDSEELVKNTGISVEEVCITPLFNAFMENVGKENKGDLAEENLQSRLRGLILMFKSNRDGYLLLTTGNKSEVATGYGTLYGDMCGGLNLLADLTKTNVYKLSNYINEVSDTEIIPQNIIDKAPSAELRPNQKDQDSLPQYDVLDDIIEEYFENDATKEDLYNQYDKTLVDNVVRKFYMNEFKRRQTCLGIRLTEKAFCSNIKLPICSKDY